MKVFNVDLYEYFGLARNGGKGGFLTCFLHDNSPEMNVNRKYPGMLVFPGGAYAFCSDREAEPIAETYYANGYNVFVLRYSLAPDVKYPTQLCEAAMAMAYIRRNAKEQFTDGKHVCSIGFSAGGHLCASLSILFGVEDIEKITGVSPQEARPDAAVLSYAVINEDGHADSIQNLVGDNASLRPIVTLDKQLTENTPPLFIWHTTSDACVNVINAFQIAMAANEKGVPYSLHIFERGAHGLSIANSTVCGAEWFVDCSSSVKEWVALSLSWLADHGFGIVD